MEWVAFNNYEELAELEVLDRRVQLAMNMANFGEMTDVNGNPRKPVPLTWILKTYLGFTKEQLDSLERERVKENLWLGFNADGSTPEGMGDEGMEDEGDEGFDESEDDEDFDDEKQTQEEQSTEPEESEFINMVKSGEITPDELKMLIDADKLSDVEINELKSAGLYPEESAEEIQNQEDEAY